MSKRVRNIVFTLFTSAFLISAPLVVLHTAGYRYHFGTGRIVKTGVVSATTVPRGATLLIDGLKQSERTPAVIDDIFPGEHLIRLEREGYTSWEKTLSVNSQETTFVSDVVLFLTDAPTPTVEAEVIEFSLHAGGERFVYIAREGGWNEVWLYDTKRESNTLLARFPEDETADYRIDWSADASHIALTVDGRSQTTALIETTRGETMDLDALLPNHLAGWWDTEQGDTYFARTPDGVVKVDVSSERLEALPLDAMAVRTEGNTHLLAQKVDDRVILSRLEGDVAQLIAYLPLGDYRFHATPREDLLLLEDQKRERIFVIDAENADRPILLNAVASSFEWRREGAELLYSDGFDIHIYHAEEHTDQTLTRLSRPITATAWYPEGNAILYTQNEGLYAIDLDRREGYLTTTLAEGSLLRELSVDPNGERAFFYGKIDGQEGIWTKPLQK